MEKSLLGAEVSRILDSLFFHQQILFLAVGNGNFHREATVHDSDSELVMKAQATVDFPELKIRWVKARNLGYMCHRKMGSGWSPEKRLRTCGEQRSAFDLDFSLHSHHATTLLPH
jgi:hypothetical protein